MASIERVNTDENRQVRQRRGDRDGNLDDDLNQLIKTIKTLKDYGVTMVDVPCVAANALELKSLYSCDQRYRHYTALHGLTILSFVLMAFQILLYCLLFIWRKRSQNTTYVINGIIVLLTSFIFALNIVLAVFFAEYIPNIWAVLKLQDPVCPLKL